MNYTIGICDDNQSQINIIKNYINLVECDCKLTIIESRKPIEFLEKIKVNKPDLVFLDIDMEGMSGLELGKSILDYDESIVVVYITGFEKYAMDAFNVRAFHYLLKPVTLEKFKEVLIECLKYIQTINLSKEQKEFIVKTKKEIICLKCNDIYYFEKIGHKIKIREENREIFYYDNFTNLIKEIDKDNFIRCHQGFIANVDKISSYRSKTLILSGGIEIPVSRSYIEDIKLLLAEKLFI